MKPRPLVGATSFWLLGAAGLAAGGALLARAEVVVLPAALAITLVGFQFQRGRRQPWRRFAVAAGSFAVGLAVVVVPYLAAVGARLRGQPSLGQWESAMCGTARRPSLKRPSPSARRCGSWTTAGRCRSPKRRRRRAVAAADWRRRSVNSPRSSPRPSATGSARLPSWASGGYGGRRPEGWTASCRSSSSSTAWPWSRTWRPKDISRPGTCCRWSLQGSAARATDLRRRGAGWQRRPRFGFGGNGDRLARRPPGPRWAWRPSRVFSCSRRRCMATGEDIGPQATGFNRRPEHRGRSSTPKALSASCRGGGPTKASRPGRHCATRPWRISCSNAASSPLPVTVAARFASCLEPLPSRRLRFPATARRSAPAVRCWSIVGTGSAYLAWIAARERTFREQADAARIRQNTITAARPRVRRNGHRGL